MALQDQRPARARMAPASRAPTRTRAAGTGAAPAAPPMRRTARPRGGGGRDRAGSGMSPDEVQVWMESASPEDRRLAEQALRAGGTKAAAETIRNIEDQRLVTQAAGTARRAPPVAPRTQGQQVASRSPPPTARPRAPSPSGGRQRRQSPAPSRPMVQKGGLYRGKPHAYVAGGSVTDTGKRSRRKKNNASS